MHLINTENLKIEDFPPNRIPRYVILSHRWEDEEVSFQDMQTGLALGKAGYVKIERFCDQARSNGFQHAWIDTCCIDKTSSAELSEAINSMYRWYQNAEVCYTYLSDVHTETILEDASFANSAWFTRGWTLQELIA